MESIILSLASLSVIVHLGALLYALWAAARRKVNWRGIWLAVIAGLGLILLLRFQNLVFLFQRIRDGDTHTANDLIDGSASPIFALFLLWGLVQVVSLMAARHRGAEAALQRAARLELINRISFLVSSAANLDEILQTLVDELTLALQVELGALALLDESGEYAEVVAEHLPPGSISALGDRHPVPGNPLAQEVLRTQAPVVVNDVTTDARLAAVRELVQRRGTQSLLVVPLIYSDHIIGTVGLDAVTAPRVFTPQDVELVQTVANYVAIAIERSRLRAAEQARLRMAETLSQTAAILTSTLDINQVLELILENLSNIIDYDSSAIFLREGNDLVLTAGRGFPESALINGFSFDITDSALEPVLTEQGLPMIIPDVLESEQFRKAKGTDYIRSYIGAPLWTRGKLVGLLTLDHSQPEQYNQQDAQKVMAFAYQAAIIIENARLFDEQVALTKELKARNKELLETQQKLIEAERMAVIGQVSLTMRHEINNPLTSVLGLAQWITNQHPELPGDVLKDLETIERMAVRIRDAVSKLGNAKYRTVTYMDNMTMLDLSDEDEQDQIG